MVDEKLSKLAGGIGKFIGRISTFFDKIIYPIKAQMRYKILAILISLIMLFFVLRLSHLLFTSIAMFLMLLCSFDFYKILENVKETEDNFVENENEKKVSYNRKRMVKNFGFLYILLPFTLIVLLNNRIDITFWILSFVICSKLICFFIDDILKVEVLSRKIYGNRSIFSLINNLIFSIVVGFIFSFFLKQNVFGFIIVNLIVNISIFLEEYLISQFEEVFEVEKSGSIVLSKLKGFVLPIIIVSVLYSVNFIR